MILVAMPTAMPSAPSSSSSGILAGRAHRFLHAAVIGVDELGQVLVEQGFACQWRQSALDVAGRRGLIAGEDVAEVSLAVDQISLVGQVDQGVEDRLVAVGMEFHGLADHVGHLVETAVIHVVQGLQEPSLHRLEAVVDIGNGPFADDVGGVVEEIGVKQLMQFAALSLAGLTHTGLTTQMIHDVLLAFRRILAHVELAAPG